MSADDPVDEMRDEADRMEAGVQRLGEQIEEADKKAHVARELAGEDARPRHDSSGEMETPDVDSDPDADGDAGPSDPLGEVVDDDDVAPDDDDDAGR